ncbi:MAG: ABC transporter ATP-binding protein [Rubrobacteridae bacterium]|nr:ABC transporter ATP-binding protein [Rubrobacteridae bacterium]
MLMIKARGLTKVFGKRRELYTAVDNLDLNVKEKTVYGFLGPNGAGKTTTLRMMVGLIESTSGTIEIAGTEVEFGQHKSHKFFGYLPEQPSFYNWMTGREFIGFAAGTFGIKGKEKRRITEKTLEMVDLSTAAGKKIGTYSNGMKQRLGIAQALVNDPPVVILDEPVSALDPIGRREVLEIIEKMGKNKTVILSTHILSDVDRICDDIAIVSKGKLLVESSLGELKKKYAHAVLNVEFAFDPGDKVLKISEEEWVKRVERNGLELKIWLNDSTAINNNLPLKALGDFNIGITKYAMAIPETEDLFVEILEER